MHEARQGRRLMEARSDRIPAVLGGDPVSAAADIVRSLERSVRFDELSASSCATLALRLVATTLELVAESRRGRGVGA